MTDYVRAQREFRRDCADSAKNFAHFDGFNLIFRERAYYTHAIHQSSGGSVLQDLKNAVVAGQVRLGEALSRALPNVHGKVADDRILWMVNEMNGYPNALNWYSRPTEDFPPYRVVNGVLKSVDPAGNLGDMNHPLAAKGRYFLAAPISWLEEAADTDSNVALVEMQELSGPYAKATGGGGVVCSCNKDEITRILNSFRQNFVAILNEVGAKA